MRLAEAIDPSAADMLFLWLATGSLGRDIPKDARYPSRPQALAAGRIVGYSDAAIADVAAIDSLDADPGADYWLHLLAAKNLEYAQASAPALPAAPAKKPTSKLKGR